jgi:hypothetical protein
MIINMRNRHRVLGVSFLLVFLWALPALAYDEMGAKKVAEEIKEDGFKDVTTPEGLTFRIPSDMPIERRGGLVSPVPFDEYLYIKFKNINEKLTVVDKKIDRLDETLRAIRRHLESTAASSAAPKA